MFTQTYTHTFSLSLCQVWLHLARNTLLLFMKVWINAHWRCRATDIALTTEYWWMPTHDVWPRMLPSQQNMHEYTPTTYSHRCCLHNGTWVNAHPRCTATDVAFIKSKGACTPTMYSVEFLGDVQWRLSNFLFPLLVAYRENREEGRDRNIAVCCCFYIYPALSLFPAVHEKMPQWCWKVKLCHDNFLLLLLKTRTMREDISNLARLRL